MKKVRPPLTFELANKNLSYDPLTGILVWKTTNYRQQAGDVAGFDSHGYVGVCINQKKYPAHRVAWLLMTGKFPAGHIDHINRKRADNRWKNLREVTRLEQMGNQPLRRDNVSGLKGVGWDKKRKLWRAYIGHQQKYVHLGRYKTKEEAAKAYEKAAIAHFGPGFATDAKGELRL